MKLLRIVSNDNFDLAHNIFHGPGGVIKTVNRPFIIIVNNPESIFIHKNLSFFRQIKAQARTNN